MLSGVCISQLRIFLPVLLLAVALLCAPVAMAAGKAGYRIHSGVVSGQASYGEARTAGLADFNRPIRTQLHRLDYTNHRFQHRLGQQPLLSAHARSPHRNDYSTLNQ